MTTPTTPAHVLRTIRGLPTSDGAGVSLTRVIGTQQLPELDPFLMLDEFGTEKPEDYIGGFPSHPHRGFETVTYMLDGRMRHKDNHGNEGLLTPGSVQWMTAGRGVIHSEMPEQESGRMRGFQLWVNLPARDKMTDPRYQEYAPDRIPVAQPAAGVTVKVIAGAVGEVTGPIVQPATSPVYLDIALDANAAWDYLLPEGHSAFAYAFEGAVAVGEGEAARNLPAQELAVLGGGQRLALRAGDQGARLILVAGRPLNEPVMRHGPFVMNTRQELMQAFVDFQEGRF
ncbi:pirin family protein [Xanthomonas melonis]|uniref:Pirin family protein n=1 Tax=Xanthomonas melonis TaxID=56456 RepID=A0A2S7DFK8_9XANT|nr:MULTISPECIES: pirin family protein [Xanthomonas]MCC4586756.1 pirin family protein [Xanthomonas sp. NCPPB 1067]MCC4599485.1 pirin family protein [Xanthomonas melonis]MCD0247445.1 pirin family protein [Xanthomonas melonis]MCD0260196.1 pirin family protein [Xanthomonas melonis]MCD0267124.1 pirin family protein [Xanthomonas melonis]